MPINIYNYNEKTDLENFNRVIAISLDELKAFIDEISDVLSIEFANKEQLAIIASLLHVTLDRNEDEFLQRKQLKTALDIIKTKGTIECFKILMYNFGLDIKIIPLWTADYNRNILISPPYIKIEFLPPLAIAENNVTVYNPDYQYNTKSNSFTVS